MDTKIKPHLPVYTTPPNKLVKYIEEPFDDGCGHTAIVRTAVFLDKKGVEKTMVAQVIWD